MSIPVMVFLSAVILTATHVLDGMFRRSGIKKSYFLLYMAVCIAVSLMPAYNLNRYFSFHLIYAIVFISYFVLLSRRRKTLLATKEITFIFFVMLIYIIEVICSFVLIGSGWFYYIKLTSIIAYCSFYIKRPGDSAICTGFGICLFQLLLNVRNFIIDSYLYFDLSNTEVIKTAVLCAFTAFAISYWTRVLKDKRRNKKDISENMELITSEGKK